jgi:S-formylglutathione hydrolase FrmB
METLEGSARHKFPQVNEVAPNSSCAQGSCYEDAARLLHDARHVCNQFAVPGLAADPKAANRELHLLWIGCGTDDSLFDASTSFSKFLDDAQVKHTFYKIPGAHTWIVWRQFLEEFAPQLFCAG